MNRLCRLSRRSAALVLVLTCGLGLVCGPAFAQDGSDKQAAGRAVYTKWCAPCHDPGVTHPGTHALTVKYQGVKSGVLLEWKDLSPDTVKYLVRHGISVMPQFRQTEISDQELEALAEFLSRNTPSDVPRRR
jgi:(+)-pinoresinol hydroxylase